MTETTTTAKRAPRRPEQATLLQCVVHTYGVLHGVPPMGDGIVIDLSRALRNPHSDPAMRYLTGLHEVVADHVMATRGAEKIVADAVERIDCDLRNWSNPRGLITRVFVYCMGGRHRSVAVAEEIADRLYERGWGVEVDHRDIDKPVVQAVPASESGAQAR
jgi:UPF0042 nucleotide-binding protein